MAQHINAPTPTLLPFKLIPARFKRHAEVLSIVDDGPCLFYQLLQSQQAMVPIASEAGIYYVNSTALTCSLYIFLH